MKTYGESFNPRLFLGLTSSKPKIWYNLYVIRQCSLSSEIPTDLLSLLGSDSSRRSVGICSPVQALGNLDRRAGNHPTDQSSEGWQDGLDRGYRLIITNIDPVIRTDL